MKKYFVLGFLFILVLSGCQTNNSEKIKIDDFYEKDSSNVYYTYGNEVLKDADPETFERLDSIHIYAKDKNHVYYAYKRLDNLDIDAQTFDFIDGSIYAKDKNKVYYKNHEGELTVIENANPEKFELIGVEYNCEYLARDDKNYYYQGFVLGNVDYDSFEIMDAHYAKDKNYVYYFYYDFYLDNDGRISFQDSLNLDIESLEYLGAGFLKDENYIYYHNKSKFGEKSYLTKRDEIDISTFKVLGNSYAKDKSNVYYSGKKIEGVDVKTFQFLGVSNDSEKIPHARDKDNCYVGNKIIDMSECKNFEN